VFDEDAKWDWSSEQASSEFIIDYVSVTDPAMVTVRQEGAWDQDSMSATTKSSRCTTTKSACCATTRQVSSMLSCIRLAGRRPRWCPAKLLFHLGQHGSDGAGGASR
jgi:hypothetical protein